MTKKESAGTIPELISRPEILWNAEPSSWPGLRNKTTTITCSHAGSLVSGFWSSLRSSPPLVTDPACTAWSAFVRPLHLCWWNPSRLQVLLLYVCYCCDFPPPNSVIKQQTTGRPPRSLRNNRHSSDSCSRELARAQSALAIFLLPASSGFTSKFSISSSRGESTYLPICSNSICVVLFVRNLISLCRS
jgi:hypothetical protein